MAEQDLGDRVWHAWNCLPRNKRGRLPSYRERESEFGLSGATLSKLISGERRTVDADTLPKLAAALDVDSRWLLEGVGPAPSTTWPIPPRPIRFDKEGNEIAVTPPQDPIQLAAYRYPNREAAIKEIAAEGRWPEAVVRDAADRHAVKLRSKSDPPKTAWISVIRQQLRLDELGAQELATPATHEDFEPPPKKPSAEPPPVSPGRRSKRRAARSR